MRLLLIFPLHRLRVTGFPLALAGSGTNLATHGTKLSEHGGPVILAPGNRSPLAEVYPAA